MECRECCNNIQPFLKNKLKYEKSRQLLKHVEECDSCKDQLRNGFIFLEGLKRLESGSDFNLIKDFEIMMDEALEESEEVHKGRIFLQVLFGIIIFMVIVILLYGLFI